MHYRLHPVIAVFTFAITLGLSVKSFAQDHAAPAAPTAPADLAARRLAAISQPVLQPASQPLPPSTQSVVEKQFDQLFDSDPHIRDQAKTDLMGIDPADLDVLKRLVKQKSPLPPEVLTAVHEVVVQVLLSHQKYTNLNQQEVDTSTRQGPFFLGIFWQNPAEEGRLGLTVDERLPGFPSYRFLRKGDLILDVTVHQGLLPNPTHNVDDLKTAIRMAPGVQDVVLDVIRNGEQISIPITMAPRPIESGPPDEQQQALPPQNHTRAIEEFIGARMVSAEDYWHANFETDQSAQAAE